MKKIPRLLPFILSLTLLASATAQAAAIKENETSLMKIDEYLGVLPGVGETMLISPDCQHLALVVKKADQFGWKIDAKKPIYYSKLGPGRWSPDGNSFAYSIPDGSKWRMIVHGDTAAAFDSVGYPLWKPDSSSLAYTATKNNKSFIINGNQKSRSYEDISQLQFSSDGTSLAAIVHQNGKDILWINGHEELSADSIQDFVWSSNSAQFACAAKSGTKWTVHHNGTSSKEVDSVQLLTISPDGTHVAYVAAVSGGFVVRQGAPKASRGAAKVQQLILDGKIIDTQADPAFTYTGIVFSPDSQHLAWTAGHFGREIQVYYNGKKDQEYTNVSTPVWSADSQHIAYGAVQIEGRRLQKYLITDGARSESFADLTHPIWNPTTAALAYAIVPETSTKKCLVVYNGNKSPKYDTATDLLFNSDGKYFSYLALDEKGAFAVINGNRSKSYDGFLGNKKSSFDADGNLHVVALKNGHNVVHVEFELRDDN